MTAWTLAPTASDWADAAALLLSARRVLLLAHVAPDADAVGSALALGLGLKGHGIEVVVSFGDEPFVLPANLTFLPGQELLLPAAKVTGEFDVAVTLDVSAIARLGNLVESAQSAAKLLVVDHHRTYTGFGDVHLVDTTAPATAVLVIRLLDECGLVLTPAIATCLYAGLLTDTGSFRYANVDADTHVIAARLHSVGIDHVHVGRSLYEDQPFAAMRLQGEAMSRTLVDFAAVSGRGMAWTIVTKSERLASGQSIDVLERVIDGLRTSVEVEVAVVFKEDDTGQWRVSTRSKGQVDVGSVCQALGGGGHLYAGGFESHDSPEVILATLRDVLAAQP